MAVPAIKKQRKLAEFILAAILVSASFFYIASITPSSFGFYHDDGIYVVTAKALATGKGYRIISLPGEPVQTKSPPLHPLLLSVIWRVYPQFPGNLPAMMLLSVLATTAALALSYVYLTRHGYATKWQALLVVGLTAINIRTVILGTGVYSEMFYMAFSIAGLYLAERYEREKGWVKATVLGTVIGLAFLTRSAGIVLLAAVASYYPFRKQFKAYLLPVSVGASIILAWMVWGLINKPADVGVNAAYHESYFQTLNQVIKSLQSQSDESTITILAGIILKNIKMLMVTSAPLVCLGLPYGWLKGFNTYLQFAGTSLIFIAFALIAAGFLRSCRARFRLLHLYVLGYLALHVLWPYGSYDRFVMPILPFLLLFVIIECNALARMVLTEFAPGGQIAKRISAAFIGLVLLSLVGLASYSYASGLFRSLPSLRQINASRTADDLAAGEWIIEHTDPSDVLVCYRDPTYYLYTDRRATRSYALREGGIVLDSKVGTSEQAKTIFRIIEENRASYLIITSSDFDLESEGASYRASLKALLEENPQVFTRVFESATGSSAIYRIQNSGG
jgi:hypothetical protein